MTSIDFAICIVYLLFVLALGWWCSGKQETNEDYFVGSRKMNWFAVGVSLFATTFSALSFVGLPQKAAFEDYHLFLAILFIPLVGAPLVGWLLIPLYQRLRLTSAYEYLELRFDRRLRLVGSLLASLYALGWMGSMLYATCLILQVVLQLSDWQMFGVLIGVGLFTTVYTTIGGFKAVIWTDVTQALVLSVGMLLVVWLAVARIPGGWSTVWTVGNAHERFNMFDMKFDLYNSRNFYAACSYGVFAYVASQATSQNAVQRYVSMPSVGAARASLVVNGFMIAAVCLLFFLVGSVIFAYYHHALPLEAVAGSGFPQHHEFAVNGEEVAIKPDQLAPYFIQHELAAPGLMGLLLSGLFAAVMSSIDSSANSLTTLLVCDWLGEEKLALRKTRWICAGFGLLAIVSALLVPLLGNNVFDIIIRIAGALFGPLLGLFALGMFNPRANGPGAFIGFLAGVVCLAVSFWCGISPWWFGAVTCMPTLLVGALASLFFPRPPAALTAGLVYPFTPPAKDGAAE
ncbi:sodium:solute symporter family transporter [Lignipirellula cremea]|uniref:Sodium/glucose cotransporter n=1 Tax=Lignipirellula cremea TaxID=2528010 RepID=A0A518DTW1_9BACT|nr:sodium/solute symporter [Lignipirellula cremea]QDU95273.1 Sodium/glucose cotransporter [Lignipirellula cremea]